MYIKKFNFSNLYNFLENASSSEGYEHTDDAKQKIVKRLQAKSNHPFWGKHHYDKAKSLISRPGLLNLMFGKTHSEETKNLMRSKKSKIP
jgi:group I intron endonuclease